MNSTIISKFIMNREGYRLEVPSLCLLMDSDFSVQFSQTVYLFYLLHGYIYEKSFCYYLFCPFQRATQQIILHISNEPQFS